MSKKLKLESDLLSVSKPYEFLVGHHVKKINPSCPHYKSTGEVVGVTPEGNITYITNNKGATWTPGEVLTKSWDQLMRIFTHQAIPAFALTTESNKSGKRKRK